MNTKAGTQDGFVRSLMISIALFLFGDKITTVSEIGIRVYDLAGGSKSKPEFVLEMSLLALAIGVSAVIYLTSLKKEHDPKEDQTILAGAMVGIIAGLLEITKAAISLDANVSEFSCELITFLSFIWRFFLFLQFHLQSFPILGWKNIENSYTLFLKFYLFQYYVELLFN